MFFSYPSHVVTPQDEHLNNLLLTAVSNEDFESVKALVDQGAQVNAQNKHKESALYLASQRGNGRIVRWLLEKGANINHQSLHGETALHAAAIMGWEDAVSELLAHGADPTLCTTDGATPLHGAAYYSHANIAQLLITHCPEQVSITTHLGETPLHWAACSNNAQVVSLLVKSSANINAQTEGELWTPLHVAASKGNADIVDALLKAGADPDILTSNQKTALEIAQEKNQHSVLTLFKDHNRAQLNQKFLQALIQENVSEEEVKQFLKEGAEITAKDAKGYTPLHYAAATGNSAIVRLLLAQPGVLINAQSNNKFTPSHIATRLSVTGVSDVVKCLIEEAKADINLAPAEGITVLHCAIFVNNFELVKYLINRGADLHTNNGKDGLTVLHLAVEKESVEMVDYFLDKVNVNATAANGETALSLAIKKNNLDLVKQLTRAGAQVDERAEKATKERVAPAIREYLSEVQDLNRRFVEAVKNQHLSEIQNLLKQFAQVNSRTPEGDAPLHVAVRSGNTEMCKKLITVGANLEAKDKDGNSPLHLAVKHKQEAIVSLLLSHGVSAHTPNQAGKTAFNLALSSGNDEMCKNLLKANADLRAQVKVSDCFLREAIAYKQPAMVELLLAYDAPVDATNFSSETALHLAVCSGSTEICEKLIKAGAALNASDESGNNPLHLAVELKHEAMVALLLDYGAPVDATNASSETALHCAVRSGNTEIVEKIIKAGANLGAQDRYGNSPLHIAVHFEHEAMVDLLLDYEAPAQDRNHENKTPLEVAVIKSSLSVVKKLLPLSQFQFLKSIPRKGTQRSIFVEKAVTRLEHLSELDSSDRMKEFLKEEQPRINNQLLAAAKKGGADVTAFEKALEQGAHINACYKNGRTPLYLAAETGSLEKVHYLIRMGADISLQATLKKQPPLILSPLDIAKQNGHEEVIKFLESIKDLKKELTTAAQEGNSETIERLLKPISPLSTLACRRYAIAESLSVAAKRGHFEVVKVLLTAGANANARNTKGRAALHEAAKKGHLDVLALLLEAGAFVDFPAKSGVTPLYLASKNNHQAVVVELLKFGAKVNRKIHREQAETALHLAARMNNRELAEKLLLYGADTQIKNANKQTVLEIAQPNVKKLLQAYEQDTHNLLEALCQSDSRRVEAFIQKGISLDIRDKKGLPLLHLATIHHTENNIIAFLLDNNYSEINQVDGNGCTALHHAITENKADFVRYLISRGADIHVTIRGRFNALFSAVACENVEMVDYFLRKIDINSRIYGETALPLAIKNNSLTLVKKLIDAGADLNVDANVVAQASPAIRNYLVERKQLNNRFLEAVSTNQLEKAQRLLAQGAQINSYITKGGFTGLHLAAKFNDGTMVDLLLEHGASVKAENYHRQTAFHVAASLGNTVVSEQLIKAGADPNAQDMKGNSPLHIAAQSGHTDLVCLLLESGASASAQNLRGQTALYVAVKKGHKTAVETLCQYEADFKDIERILTYSKEWTHQNVDEKDTDEIENFKDCCYRLEEVKKIIIDLEKYIKDYKSSSNKSDISQSLESYLPAKLGRGLCGANIKFESGSTFFFELTSCLEDLEKWTEFYNLLRMYHLDLNATISTGRTVLHAAVAKNSLAKVQILLQAGANIELKDSDGYSPLHLLAKKKYTSTTQQLCNCLLDYASYELIQEVSLLPDISPEISALLEARIEDCSRLGMGIQDKYLAALVPELAYCQSLRPKGRDKLVPVTGYKKKLNFKKVNDFPSLTALSSSSASSATTLPCKTLVENSTEYGYRLKLHGEDSGLPKLFIFAGREENALLPPQELGAQPVLVVTSEEYIKLKDKIPNYCQALEVVTLRQGGSAYDPRTISARRLAAFLCAYKLDFDHCFMVDDNIQTLHWMPQEQALLLFLWQKLLAENHVCMAVRTYNQHRFIARDERRMGDKFFCVNINKLKERFPEPKDCFNFVYAPSLQYAWGEDVLVQMLWEHAFPKHGYNTYELNDVVLERSPHHKNAFATNASSSPTQPEHQAKPFKVTYIEIPKFLAENNQSSPATFYCKAYFEVLAALHVEIETSITQANAKVARYRQKDLFEEHFKANRIALPPRQDLSAFLPSEGAAPSIPGFFKHIQTLLRNKPQLLDEHNGILRLRDYQVEALQAFANQACSKGVISLATGCGKTFFQIALLVLARCYFGAASPSCVMVLPTRQLVDQAYKDFIDQAERLHSDEFDMTKIVKVMSDPQAIQAVSARLNHSLLEGGILLFCKESFFKFQEITLSLGREEFLPPLVLLDEFHLVSVSKMRKITSTRLDEEDAVEDELDEETEAGLAEQKSAVTSVLNHFSNDNTLKLFLSATPKYPEIPTIYSYPRREALKNGWLPPLAMVKLEGHYSAENASKYGENILELLKEIRLPNGNCLTAESGLIFVKNKAQADKIAKQLKGNGLSTKAVHSGLSGAKKIIESFCRGDQKAPQVLVAVQMLKIGFSSPRVNWLLDLSSGMDEHHVAQRVGRVCRQGHDKNKVGLFISFSNYNIEYLGIEGPNYPGGCYDREAEKLLAPAFKEQLKAPRSLQLLESAQERTACTPDSASSARTGSASSNTSNTSSAAATPKRRKRKSPAYSEQQKISSRLLQLNIIQAHNSCTPDSISSANSASSAAAPSSNQKRKRGAEERVQLSPIPRQNRAEPSGVYLSKTFQRQVSNHSPDSTASPASYLSSALPMLTSSTPGYAGRSSSDIERAKTAAKMAAQKRRGSTVFYNNVSSASSVAAEESVKKPRRD